MVKFRDSHVTKGGEWEAEVDVLCLSALGSVYTSSDPMLFLMKHWELIFPELQGDQESQPLNLAGPVVRSSSSTSITGSEEHVSSALSKTLGQTSHAHGNSPSSPVQQPHLGSSPSLGSNPSLSFSLRSRSLRKSPSTPTFVVWAEELQQGDGDRLLRYEVVFHPTDLGNHKQEIKHCLLSATRSGSAVHVCRVTGSESFYFRHKELMRNIIESFTSCPLP